MRKLPVLTFLIAFATSACWPWAVSSTDSGPLPPDPDEVISAPAWVDEVEFIYLESWPVQVRAIVRGTLPSPCHTVVWSLQDGTDGVAITVSSAIGADEVCAAVVAEPFEVIIPVGDYTSGTHTVSINGETYDFTI